MSGLDGVVCWETTRDVSIGVHELNTLIRVARPVLCRDADRNVVCRNVLGYHGVGADGTAFTDGDRAQDFRSRTDGDVVTQGWVALGLGEHLSTQGDTVVEHDAVANFGGFADDDAHAVVDEETTADRGTRVDLNAGQESGELRQNASWSLVSAYPPGVGDAVGPDSVQAGVHDGIFDVTTGGWIVIASVLQVFADHAY